MNKFVAEKKTAIEWIINNLRNIDNGIYSPEFSATGRTTSSRLVNVQWQLQLHRSAAPGCVAISLRNFTDVEVSVTFEVRVYKARDMLDECKIEGKSGKTESCVLDLDVGDGFFTEPDISELKDLKVLCYISNVKSGANDGVEPEDDKVSEHTAHYESLLETGKFGDVTFKIGEKSVHLHKAILTSASAVFRAMFDHEMREQKESVVDVVDVDFDVMKEMLRYIYTRRVNGIEKIAGELFVVADRYSVEGLKLMCEKQLVDKLGIGNALDYFEMCVKYDMAHLKAEVLEFLVHHMKELVGTSEFKELSSECKDELFGYIATKTLIIDDRRARRDRIDDRLDVHFD